MTPIEFVEAYKKHGSCKAIWRAQGQRGWKRILRAMHLAVAQGLMQPLALGRKGREEVVQPALALGEVKATQARIEHRPGVVARHIFTSAQNNTLIHEPFWRSLQAFASSIGARIHVARFLYDKIGLGSKNDKDQLKKGKGTARDVRWDDRLEPYLSDERLEIAPGLVWCGEINMLPTAKRPLTGLEVYTARSSGIFPHPKIAMDSIPSARGAPTKFNYTTGAVTLRNYIKRKAGFEAEFHHCYGALLAEVDSDGDWFCRQLNADSEGTIYDLTTRVKDGTVTHGHRPAGINWGDIHVAEMDPVVRRLAWGAGGMLDTLRPERQFFQDVLHFRGRSHHEIKNPHKMFKRFCQQVDNVRAEVSGVADFYAESHRAWCEGVTVDSNHHHHIGRWLAEQNGLADPVNAEFWLAMNQRILASIREGRSERYLAEALAEIEREEALAVCRFLDDGESYIMCPEAHGGIECGQHGDLGPNGSRGSARAFARMGRKMNRGHEHSASIVDSVYTAGTCGLLDPDWTKGPGSWSHTHTLTYPNGKRAQLTMWNGKWRVA